MTALTIALRNLPANVRGALWMLAAAGGFSCMAAIAKLMGARLDSFQITFFRCAVALVFLLPFAMASGFVATMRTKQLGLHLTRSFIGVAAMFCGFYAFTQLPLADAVAFSFTKPLFVILLAVPLLGEIIRWRRWTATAIGFAGVVIMMRPGQQGFDPAAFAAIGGAACVAIAVVCVKKLSAEEKVLTMMLYFGFISTAVSAVAASFVWITPTAEEFALLCVMGVLGALGQICIINAYRTGEATAVAPFDYARLLFAGSFGILFFLEVPDIWTLSGAAVIIASTLYIAQREARLGKTKDPESVARQHSQRLA